MSGKSRAGWAAAGLVLLGFALGVLADHLWLADRMHHRPETELTHGEAVAVMLESLDLTDEQRASVGAIFDRYQAKVEEQLEAIHPKLLATIDSARFEIEALLDPRQLETFRNWLRAEHERGRPTPFILH